MAPGRGIVVVAASAGGLEPLRTLLRNLPADLPAALLVVLHVPSTGGRTLPRILDRAGPLSAGTAVDGEPVRPGRVYVAPPDQHLLVIGDAVRLSRAPRQNGVRPAADPLFRSAALHAGPRVTAVVLSGTLDDAALGSATVERRGGQVVVQDPDEADYEGMPRSTIAATRRPLVTAASGLAGAVTRLAKQFTEELQVTGPRGMPGGPAPRARSSRCGTGCIASRCSPRGLSVPLARARRSPGSPSWWRTRHPHRGSWFLGQWTSPAPTGWPAACSRPVTPGCCR